MSDFVVSHGGARISIEPGRGRLSFLDNKVDHATGAEDPIGIPPDLPMPS